MKKQLRKTIHSASICSLLIFVFVVTSYAEEHPFILYSASEVDAVNARLHRDPYASWFAAELAEAESILSLSLAWGEGGVPPQTEAYYAKVLAFSSVFADSLNENKAAFGREAAIVLSKIPDDNYSTFFTDDLAVSEAALFWAEAYDMLKGADFDFTAGDTGVTDSAIRERLTALRRYMARDSYIFFAQAPAIGTDFLSASWPGADFADNHHVKLQAALSVLALATIDVSGSQTALGDAVIKLTDALKTMTVSSDAQTDGIWAEGPNYQQYSAHQYLTAADALKRLDVINLYDAVPALLAAHLTLPEYVMPDAYMPPWDDNRAVIFDLAGLLYSQHDDSPGRDMLHWMWTLGGQKVNKAFRADYIARYDDSAASLMSPEEISDEASGFFPVSGFSRFRSSWNPDPVWLLMQSENGEAHTNGQAHEHPDQNSIILHAYGELMLLDSGFAGWSQRDATKYAVNHNLILVNGLGPPASTQPPFGIGSWSIAGQGATLSDYFATEGLDYAKSETIYQNTEFIRHVIFPGGRYFILFDTLFGGVESDYTFLLHGNGGGTSGGTFELTDGGAVWSREKAALRSYIVATGETIGFSSSEMSHAVYSNELLTHSVLQATQRGVVENFMTILLPSRTGQDSPLLTELYVVNGRGIALNDDSGVEYAFTKLPGEEASSLTTPHNLSSDANFYHARYDVLDSLESLFILDGMYFDENGSRTFASSNTLTAFIDYSDDDMISGHVRSSGEVEITLNDVFAESISFEGVPLVFIQDGESVTFSISGSGDIAIVKTVPLIVIEPPADVLISDIPDDHGHALKLSWTASLSESEMLVDYYRIYRSRTDTVGEILPLSDFTSSADLIAWEEMATVLVDSVSAGVNVFTDTTLPLNGERYYYWLDAVGAGAVSAKTAARWANPVSVDLQPSEIILGNPHPNPFNLSTIIPLNLPNAAQFELAIYDMSGGKIRTLAREIAGAGRRDFLWDGSDSDGRTVASGLYLVSLKSGGRMWWRRIALVK